MKRSRNPPAPHQWLLFSVLIAAILQQAEGDARAKTINVTCAAQTMHNTTSFVPYSISVLGNISSQMQASGFGWAINGTGPDANYAIGQCHGDLTLEDCFLCYAAARTTIPVCYPKSGGRVYLDGCFLRYGNYNFFKEYSTPEDHAVCGNATRKGSAFLEPARQAVLQAVASAPRNDFFARTRVAVPGAVNQSAYVLANCWKTLDKSSCKACLESASVLILGCLPWSEGRALKAGCFVRYSDIDFLNKTQRKRIHEGTIIVHVFSVITSLIVLVVGALVGVHIWKHRNIQRKRRGSNDTEKLAKTLIDGSLNFKYLTLKKATGSFNDANKLGQGGFGAVYKGVLADGREIAVKRLHFNNRHRAADFFNEVNIISSVEHKNLVRLLGCSCSGPESLLVYEFLPNRSLDHFIFDTHRGKALNWEKRYEIIIGTAQGLTYLHEKSNVRIIHRDIKPSNILLDIKLGAKIADFGLARSFEDDKSHISTGIAGTLGYMAPEYLAHGQLTEKADVYSFGVLLLQIVTGRQNNRNKNSEPSDSLVIIAWKHFQLGTAEELIDPNIKVRDYYHDSSIKNEVLRVMRIGLLCTQEGPSLRPAMSKALHRLRKKDEELTMPTNPPFTDDTTMALKDVHRKDYDPSNPSNSGSFATVSYSSFYPR